MGYQTTWYLWWNGLPNNVVSLVEWATKQRGISGEYVVRLIRVMLVDAREEQKKIQDLEENCSVSCCYCRTVTMSAEPVKSSTLSGAKWQT